MNVTACERRYGALAGPSEADALCARNLIVRCFLEVQTETAVRDGEPAPSSANHAHSRAQAAVRRAFQWTGGDYENPDRASLVRVLGSLAEVAGLLGAPLDIIELHTQEIVTTLRRLPD
jgi:hypothetical protein